MKTTKIYYVDFVSKMFIDVVEVINPEVSDEQVQGDDIYFAQEVCDPSKHGGR